MPVIPTPGACVACGNGGGGGSDSIDVEDLLLCDVDPANGNVVGTAIAVYEYDSTGAPVGPPTFVVPGTNDPYVPQFALQPCPAGASCGAPQQFCFASSTTADVPGRMYDLTFTLGAGFAVTGIIRDLVKAPFNVLWDVNDSTGAQFTTDLQATIQSQFPGQTVTVTQVAPAACDGTGQFAVHIECLRLDQTPPTLLQLEYNAGRDLVQNAPFAETPPLSPPVQNGNYGYHLLARQDDPGPFPGFPPSARANCTNVANRGWETNDVGRTFEIWGQDVAGGVTPTPRGTPVQEVASDGPPPGELSTIWQTFVVPAAGNFTIRLIHGARDPGEQHRIFLSTGDTNSTGPGDIINNVTNPPAVYGGNPWTVFNQTVPLAAGVYTLAMSTTNPVGGSRGGLFTDMRVFVDLPGQQSNFINNDDTCTVSVTSQDTTCAFFTPNCSNGDIVGWTNTATGEQFTNAAFWAQVPAPTCCTSEGSGSGGDAALGNLVHTYLVCGQTDTGPRTLSHVVITDQNGAAISDQFVDTTGALVTPSSWQPGECPSAASRTTLGPVCYVANPNPGVPSSQGFMTLDGTGSPVLYNLLGNVVVTGTYTIVICPEHTQQSHILCDAGNANHQFLAWYTDSPVTGESDLQWTFELDGNTPYAPVGPVGLCPDSSLDTEVVELCDVQAGGAVVPFLRVLTYNEAGTLVVASDQDGNGLPYVPTGSVTVCASVDIFEHVLCDSTGATFIRRFVLNGGTLVASGDVTLDGLTPFAPVGAVGECGPTTVDNGLDVEVEQLCDANGARFLRKYVYNADTGVFASITDTLLDGTTAFAPVAPVGGCTVAATVEFDEELLVLCDSAAPTPNRFLRRYSYNATTQALVVTNTALDGITPFVPTGAVQVCPQVVATDLDFLELVLCDSNSNQFIQRLTFNSTTGAVTNTTNTTLTGGAFAPVGAISLCSTCCPVVLDEFCTNVGSTLGVSIRNPNGSISLIDAVTGAAITAANRVTCPAANGNLPATVAADHFDVVPGTPWTPAAIPAGRRLVGLSYTVVAGTVTTVDATGATAIAGIPAGYNADWSVSDDRETLTPPASITAAPLSRAIVTMTTAL